MIAQGAGALTSNRCRAQVQHPGSPTSVELTGKPALPVEEIPTQIARVTPSCPEPCLTAQTTYRGALEGMERDDVA